MAVALYVVGGLAGDARAQDSQCLRFFEHSNFNGRQWSWCNGQRPDYSWNDQVSSIIVPDGQRLTVFEHSQQGGKSKSFIGRVANVGSDFNDIISSWSLAAIDTSGCVTAYEHANYGGRAWPFCPASVGVPTPSFSEWNDRISSVRVPKGHAASFCVDLTHENGVARGQTLCRSYFRDVAWVGDTLNDKFSFIQWGGFDDSRFVMALMSDPQYYYCESDACQKGPGDSATANKWHSDSIQSLSRGTSNFAGVIVNGDITNTEDYDQIENYKNDYEKKLFNLYIGLGNHDYDNYYRKWCAGGSDAIAWGYCTRRMLTFLDEHVKSIPYQAYDLTTDSWSRTGSYGYAWDIGNYRFFQLNNYPAWELEFSVFVSSRAGSETFHITKSMNWLAQQLAATPPGMNVVINMHGMSSSMFNAAGRAAPPADTDRDKYDEAQRSTTEASDYSAFLAALDRHPNVRAIFTGHLHQRIGRALPVSTPAGKVIPVFFTGSAEYNRYLKVEFGTSKLVVQAIDSRQGLLTLYGAADEVAY